MHLPRSSTIVRLSLSALLAIAIVALTTANIPDYIFLRERFATSLVHSHATENKPAMKMDLWGGIHPTDRPAAPFGDWGEDSFVELVKEIHITLLKLGGIENITISSPPHDIDVSSLPAG